MKIKISLIFILLMSQLSSNSQSIFETFDNYDVGVNVGEVSSNFDPWGFDVSVDTEV